jgi:signal peptidase II
LIDIGTKYLAVTRLQERTPIDVVGKYLRWVLVYNKGAVFGTNPAGLVPWLQPNILLSAFMLCAIAFLLLYYRTLKKNEVMMHIGLMLVLPGAFGNFYDRAFHGKMGVVDFIQMGIPEGKYWFINIPEDGWYWFIYNVADIFVTAGVAVMLVNFGIEAVRKRPAVEAPPDIVEKEAAKDEES